MEGKLGVRWKGKAVGSLVDPVPDMWYLTGSWEPADTEAASDFEGVIGRQDARQSYERLDGQWVELVEVDDEGQAHLLPAIVISLSDGRLWVRRVFSPEALARRPREKPWWRFW